MSKKEEDTPKEKVETPSVEDQLADLTNKLQTLEGKATQAEENWKNEQRVSSRKEQEIQSLQGRISDMGSSNEMSQAMMALLAQQSGRSAEEIEGEVQANKPDLLKGFQALQQKAKIDKQQDEAKKIGEQYRKRVEALGLTSKDKAYREIYRDVREGNFEFADVAIAALEAEKAKQVAEQPQGTEDERFERRLEEEKRKWAEEEGLLTTETGGPSASSMSAQEAKKEYIAGNISDEEAKRRGADFS